MKVPILAELPRELVKIQNRWCDLDRKHQDELYAAEFVGPFARLFAKLPLCGAPAEMPKPRALISVLGLSWQPVALMAAWCQPKRLLVIGTADSLEAQVSGEHVLSLIARVAGLLAAHVEHRDVRDFGEAGMYRIARDFVRELNLPPREVFIDPTGGKKSMSASAALAGFMLGTPLVYVDYGEYHGPNRIPVAGTEYPRLLANPLEVFGDLALRDVFAAFNRSDFQEAERLAQRLADRLYEPREAQCLERLARGYAAWDRFDFQAAQTALADARVLLDQHSGQGGWSWAPAVTEALSENLLGLDSLAKIEAKPNRVIDGLPLLAWYLSAAERLLAAKKISLAVLLTYAAVERYSDLCLLDDFGLDDEKPNYSTVKVKLDEQRERYVAAGKQLFGAGYKYRDPDGPLGFAAGAQLLAALSPMRLDVGDLGTLTGLSAARNKCEYEHGFLPKIPSDEDAKRYLRKAKDVIARGCTTPADLQRQIDAYSFPKLIS